MIKDELVTIIIPVYNVEKYIRKCIESCLSQTYEKIEIIIIDDGSTDKSGKICDEYSKNKKIRVIHQKNSGVSKARNIGIKKYSTGKWLVFIDADDYIDPHFVEYMVSLVKKDNLDFGILTKCYISNDEVNHCEKIERVDSDRATELLLSQEVLVGCWNKIYKKSYLIKNNIFFQENLYYGEGLNFIIDSAQNTNKIIISNKKLYYYRKNNVESATSSFNIEKYLNGEKSLTRIHENIKRWPAGVRRQYDIHYAMFYLNLATDIATMNKDHTNKQLYTDSIKKIRKKMNIIFYSETSIKNKLKMILACISPKLLAQLRRPRRAKLIKDSV